MGIPDFERETRVGRGASLDIKRKIKLHRNDKNKKGRARTASRVINKVRKKKYYEHMGSRSSQDTYFLAEDI